MSASESRRTGLLRVLSYGRVASAEAFARQAELLARERAVVSAARVLDSLEGGHPLPPLAVLLVFGDARSFAEVVRAILARLRLAACVLAADVGGAGPALARAELERLARDGVALGLRGRQSGASAGAGAGAKASAEIRRALLALEELAPGAPRVLAHGPVPAVEAARAAGVELAFSPRAGPNDLASADPLDLAASAADAAAPPEELRALLASAPDAPERPERARSRRAARRERARLRFVHRPLDALLASLAPSSLRSALRGVARRRSAHYERLRSLARLARAPLPPLAGALRRALVDVRRLGLGAREVELAGHGSAATVFLLRGAPGAAEEPRYVLKVYRWTLGLPAPRLAQYARRHRSRYEELERRLGPHVLRTHFLVVHGPLRGLPVAACLQPRVEGAIDLLALGDEELLALVRARGAAGELAGFARRALAAREAGFLPDVLGRGNVLLVEERGGPAVRLIDYGLFDLRTRDAPVADEAVEAAARRLEGLLRALADDSGRPRSAARPS